VIGEVLDPLEHVAMVHGHAAPEARRDEMIVDLDPVAAAVLAEA